MYAEKELRDNPNLAPLMIQIDRCLLSDSFGRKELEVDADIDSFIATQKEKETFRRKFNVMNSGRYTLLSFVDKESYLLIKRK